MISKLRSAAILAGAVVMAATTLTATAEARVQIPLGPQVLVSPQPQPGDCKVQREVAYGHTQGQAIATWSAIVNAKFGPLWSNWAAAKNKVLVPINGGSTWMAVAQPCFYYPVL